MHLFITKPVIINSTLEITEERLLHHMSTVLRMQPGDACVIQSEEAGIVYRRTVELNAVSDKMIAGKIVQLDMNTEVFNKVIAMVVGLPNKMSKTDLIVQKLTEVGVQKIYFWKAERSQLKEISDNRLDRLQKIALEATEQSWGWTVPEIAYVSPEAIQSKFDLCVVFRQDGSTSPHEGVHVQSVLGVIGPEGGLSENDIQERKSEKTITQSLGVSILRMETAAIIGGWQLVNTFA